jgi:hypothetical protein
MQLTQWRVPVAKWVAWGCDPAQAQGAPELAFIEPMLRRRLSPLARAALHAAYACAREVPSVRMVYASRHGELGRTIESLHNLAHAEALSPTNFSLSVLNSVAGMFSIARQDTAASTAISAGLETFGFGLMEASMRAELDSSSPVLYVYADTQAPEPIGRQHGDPAAPLALALLIGGECANQTLQIFTKMSNAPRSEEPQAMACFTALGGKFSCWHSGHRKWEMQLA